MRRLHPLIFNLLVDINVCAINLDCDLQFERHCCLGKLHYLIAHRHVAQGVPHNKHVAVQLPRELCHQLPLIVDILKTLPCAISNQGYTERVRILRGSCVRHSTLKRSSLVEAYSVPVAANLLHLYRLVVVIVAAHKAYANSG